MPISVTKPTVGGSNGTWGTELNTALDTIVNGVNNLEAAGGIPKTTVTAKGDLIAGTAASTVTRVPVGANGYMLTADSAATHNLRWTLPPGSVVARFIQTAGQSIPNASVTPLTWNTIAYDRYGAMSTGASTYTPGLAGNYELTGGVSFVNNTTGIRMCYWAVDGTAYSGSGATENATTGGFQTSLSARPTVVNITAGQSISLYVYQSSTAALSTSASNQHMSTMTVKWLGT